MFLAGVSVRLIDMMSYDESPFLRRLKATLKDLLAALQNNAAYVEEVKLMFAHLHRPVLFIFGHFHSVNILVAKPSIYSCYRLKMLV